MKKALWKAIEAYRNSTSMEQQWRNRDALSILIDEALTLAELEPAQDHIADAGNMVPENCGTGHCSCIECVKTCVWTPMDDEYTPDTWESACGEAWSFIDGGPVENNCRFCHGCGKPVEVKEAAHE